MTRQHIDIDFTLRRVFGKNSFRPLQREVIQAVIEGHDVFLQAATSFGKSLCYQLPAVVCHGITIVVSPLLSLMVDQVSALEANGIPVATINSTTSHSKRKAIIADILSGHPHIRLLYVTPEYCQTEAFRKHVKQVHSQGELNRIAIDEAHCVSEWGHDFRPAYKELSWFRRELQNPTVPITALTATATRRVRTDIISLLGLDSTTLRRFGTSSARPNIHYCVRFIPEQSHTSAGPEMAQMHDLLAWLKGMHQRRVARLTEQNEDSDNLPHKKQPLLPPISGIIYVPLRAISSDLAEKLSASISPKIKAVAYHAGLPASDRASIQTVWAAPFKNPSKGADPSEHPAFYIVVATNAFGMGIDNPHVRFVVHWTPPRSFEGFVQESGRAGRDGRAALSIVYYNPEARERVIERILRDCNASMLDAKMIEAGVLVMGPPNADQKRAYEALSDDMKTKFRNRHALLESFEKVIRYCEETDRCRHEIIKEFSEDLELELSERSRSEPQGDHSIDIPTNTTRPICDYACDFCKEGPKSLRKRSSIILYGLHSRQIQLGNALSMREHAYEEGIPLSWFHILLAGRFLCEGCS
uniref:DNA 3'-5' helicase n=1 Tax=Coccidioides posadasii RMSCC 3488 TaxID=454284 RepID=A0A0J6FSR6_COCPO|nr:ATP-dependent DNA helicase recQ [Coccidioides posadasii RMSCC 3488]